MQLLSEIIVKTGAGHSSIQLMQGDCTAIPPEHDADILVVSAFPDNYTALPGSLMRALLDKGIDVGAMAQHKAVDLVDQLGCWLSAPLSAAQQQQFHFKRILCFEPRLQGGTPDAVVGNIFRCINNFAFEDENNVIAMPLLATGKQKVPMATMLPAMVEASIFWLETGVPLDYIKLIVKNDEQAAEAVPMFEEISRRHADSQPTGESKKAGGVPGVIGGDATATIPKPAMVAEPPKSPVAVPDYDFFISYSHVQSEQVAELVKALRSKNSGYNIFYDRSSIPPGSQWIRQISDAIQRSRCVVCILTPNYRDSNVCWDEFQCAKAKEYRSRKSLIKTINFLQDPDMPLIMSVYSYIDCTEGDTEKLRSAVSELCASYS